MPTKRLEAEVIRDCILSVSGRLDSDMGGPPVLLVARPDGLVVVDESKLGHPSDANKRSVYLLSRRAYNLSLLTVFDRPLFAVNCPKRDASVIPLQSLTMLNDQFVADEAVHFAARVAQSQPNGAGAVRCASRSPWAGCPTIGNSAAPRISSTANGQPSKHRATPRSRQTIRHLSSCVIRFSTRANSSTRSEDYSETKAPRHKERQKPERPKASIRRFRR